MSGRARDADLRADELSLGYAERLVVERLSLTIPRGRITALIGPNGSGKSTILRALARILQPREGAVYLDGKAIHREPSKEIARRLSILPQAPEAPPGLTVRELVSYGRFPYQRGFGVASTEDRGAIDRALRLTQTDGLATRPVVELSGGQRQRAWIAMALAQETPIMLLDEPTTFLDIGHQLEVVHLLQELNRSQGRTIVIVVHDLNLAARYADHLVAIDDGRIAEEGPPHRVVTAELLRSVFGVEVDVILDPRTGAPICVPFGLVEREP
jgi:iron complex transport system ATP-binding protein